MNGTQTALAIGLCVLACISTCIVLYKLGYKDGWDARGDHEHERRASRQLRETRAQSGIRAKTGPANTDGCPSWYVTVSRKSTVLAMPGISLPALSQTVPIAHRPSTDTGELRALTAATDHYLAGMHADGEAYRQEMTS